MLIVLFTLLVAAGIAQFTIASGDHPTLQGPVSPGQLPSFSPTP
jgi:hypothetical protein